MAQLQLPIVPAGTTPITAELAFDCQDGKVTYLNGHLPVFQHAQEDLAAFRLFTSQLVVNGTVSQAEIARAFAAAPPIGPSSGAAAQNGPSEAIRAPVPDSRRRSIFGRVDREIGLKFYVDGWRS